MGADVRQALISAFSEEGLVLDRPALTLLVEHLVQAGLDSGEALQQGIAKLLGAVGAGTCQAKQQGWQLGAGCLFHCVCPLALNVIQSSCTDCSLTCCSLQAQRLW